MRTKKFSKKEIKRAQATERMIPTVIFPDKIQDNQYGIKEYYAPNVVNGASCILTRTVAMDSKRDRTYVIFTDNYFYEAPKEVQEFSRAVASYHILNEDYRWAHCKNAPDYIFDRADIQAAEAIGFDEAILALEYIKSLCSFSQRREISARQKKIKLYLKKIISQEVKETC